MLKLGQRIITRAGRNYSIDEDIPKRFILSRYRERGIDALRGLLTFRRAVFRGPNVQIFYKRGLDLAELSTLGAGSIIDGSGSCGVKLARGAKIGRRSIVTATSQLSKRGVGLMMGEYSGIGDHAHIGCSGGVFLGANVIAGPYVTFHSQEHVADDLSEPIRLQGTVESPIRIEDNVWIGARVTFLAGSRVGSGSIVAAGSVVRGVFPSNCVVGGVPAKILKYR